MISTSYIALTADSTIVTWPDDPVLNINNPTDLEVAETLIADCPKPPFPPPAEP